jgi:hypothetical protein
LSPDRHPPLNGNQTRSKTACFQLSRGGPLSMTGASAFELALPSQTQRAAELPGTASHQRAPAANSTEEAHASSAVPPSLARISPFTGNSRSGRAPTHPLLGEARAFISSLDRTAGASTRQMEVGRARKPYMAQLPRASAFQSPVASQCPTLITTAPLGHMVMPSRWPDCTLRYGLQRACRKRQATQRELKRPSCPQARAHRAIRSLQFKCRW